MKRRFSLSREATLDLLSIWGHIAQTSTRELADRVETTIREKFGVLAKNPGIGHWRQDITALPVKFFPVYSYLIADLPDTRPLKILAVVRGRRDLGRVIEERLKGD